MNARCAKCGKVFYHSKPKALHCRGCAGDDEDIDHIGLALDSLTQAIVIAEEILLMSDTTSFDQGSGGDSFSGGDGSFGGAGASGDW